MVAYPFKKDEVPGQWEEDTLIDLHARINIYTIAPPVLHHGSG